MQVEAFGHSVVGADRDRNNDFFLVDPENSLFVVADGNSAHSAGNVASQKAVETIQRVVLESLDPDETRLSRDIMDEEESLRERLRYAMGQACTKIRNHSEMVPECKGMETTLTMVLVEESIAHFSHIGDSRLYLYRDGRLRRLTRDHTVVQKEIDAGRLTPELAKLAPSRDVLTQSIGAQGAIEPVTSTRPIETDDVLLLCTDGLTDSVDDNQMATVIADNPVEEIPFALADAAVSAGGGLTSDVLQAKTQLAGAQARQIQFEGVLSAAKHEFEYVFESFPKNLNSLLLLQSVFDSLPKSLEEAEKLTMKKNPSLIAARITEEISKEGINTAKATLFPTIKGIISHSEKQDFGGIVGFKRESSAKVDFSYPLNLSLSEYAGKDAEVESYLATSTRIRDQESMIKQMLRTTWDGLLTAQKNAQFLTNQARISNEFLELARTERQAGNRTLLDVLNGETAFINAQADAIAARIEVLINSYTLLSLMGGLTLDSVQLIQPKNVEN